MSSDTPRVRHVRETLLSDNWYTLKKYTFELLRRDGRWQEQSREAYDRGNGAVILLYNRIQQTVVLIRQFRFPVWINGHNGFLIEAAAGAAGNLFSFQVPQAEFANARGVNDIAAVREVIEARGGGGVLAQS